jgi:hypothetical protein
MLPMQAKAKDEKLSDDVLFGAPAIAAYVGLSERQVYHQQKNLQLRKLGAILVGSKKRLTELLTGEAS